jgi:hypothetical protein
VGPQRERTGVDLGVGRLGHRIFLAAISRPPSRLWRVGRGVD